MRHKLKYIFGLMLIYSAGFGQSKEIDIQFSQNFSWSDYEILNQDRIKNDLLSQTDAFNYILDHELYTKAMLLKDLHVFDLNGDSRLDVVFDGWSGGEPRMIVMYLNTNDGFKEIFKDYQKIQRLDFEEKKLKKVYIDEHGCCGEPFVILKTYQVNYETNYPTFLKTMESRYFDDCDSQLPSYSFDNPVRFQIDNEEYNFRFSPTINNDFNYCWDQIRGNIIGKIKKKEIGYAIGQEIDSTGRVWWFSAFPSETKFDEIFCSEHGETQTWELGWVSSRFVTKIE